MMHYKDFVASVDFDEDAGIFHGEVVNLRDVITFQGTSVEELRAAFRESVDDYLDFCATRGEAPEEPSRERVVIDVSPLVYRSIIDMAERQGVSVDRYIQNMVEQVVAQRQTTPT